MCTAVPIQQVYMLPWMPWPLPQPEVITHCFAVDLLDLEQGCLLFHMSSVDLPVSALPTFTGQEAMQYPTRAQRLDLPQHCHCNHATMHCLTGKL